MKPIFCCVAFSDCWWCLKVFVGLWACFLWVFLSVVGAYAVKVVADDKDNPALFLQVGGCAPNPFSFDPGWGVGSSEWPPLPPNLSICASLPLSPVSPRHYLTLTPTLGGRHLP
ncbi:unnamed protein product [Discosporangium mesarthrocarpum]